MKHWIKKWAPLWKPMIVSELSVYAASASYYIVLSLVPTSLLLFSLFSVLPDEQAYASIIGNLLPDYLLAAVRPLEQIRGQNPIGVVSISGAIAIWSASRSVLMIQLGLRVVMDKKQQEGYLRRRLRAIFILLILFVLFLIILSVTLLGEQLLAGMKQLGFVIPRWLQQILQYRYLYSFGVLSIALAGVYRFLPRHKLCLKECLLAGLISSSICLLFSWMFNIYVNRISSYDELYDMLGVTILGMIWIRVCISVILYAGRLAYLLQQKQYRPIMIIRSIISSD